METQKPETKPKEVKPPAVYPEPRYQSKPKWRWVGGATGDVEPE